MHQHWSCVFPGLTQYIRHYSDPSWVTMFPVSWANLQLGQLFVDQTSQRKHQSSVLLFLCVAKPINQRLYLTMAPTVRCQHSQQFGFISSKVTFNIILHTVWQLSNLTVTEMYHLKSPALNCLFNSLQLMHLFNSLTTKKTLKLPISEGNPHHHILNSQKTGYILTYEKVMWCLCEYFIQKIVIMGRHCINRNKNYHYNL